MFPRKIMISPAKKGLIWGVLYYLRTNRLPADDCYISVPCTVVPLSVFAFCFLFCFTIFYLSWTFFQIRTCVSAYR